MKKQNYYKNMIFKNILLILKLNKYFEKNIVNINNYLIL